MAGEPIYSKCGFHCNRCPAFKDNASTEVDRQRGSEIFEKYFGLHFSPGVIRCEGCQAQAPWKTGNLLPDRRCPVRDCSVYNGVTTCAHCGSFPCAEYLKRVTNAELRRQREKASGIVMTDEEYLQYIEPFEGQTHLVHLRATLKPEDIYPQKPVSADTGILPFPPKTGLPLDLQESMSHLHELLSAVFSTSAGSYINQVLIERKKPYIWGILWVMGLYGNICGDKLVLDSAICRDKKECTRLVRKTDNNLQDAVRDAITFMSQYGFDVDFKPLNKGWMLTLSLDKKAGGIAVLRSLKTYVSSLVTKFGEATYVNGYNLKGKGFRLFIRLDMRSL